MRLIATFDGGSWLASEMPWGYTRPHGSLMSNIPTEPIGSIPRPLRLIEAVAEAGGNTPALDALYDEAIRDTIEGR